MFRKIAVFSLIIPWLLFSGCASRPADERPTIFVSILPLRGIVSEIVGDDFRVEVLVPPGMNPESFEPTPRQMIDLNRSQLIFNIGWIDFEQNMLSKIEDRRKVIDLHRGIEPIAGSCSHADAEKEHRHGVDPHIWTSPRELRTMADNAYRAIHELYPDSTVYAVNYQCLADKLQALDDSVAERLKQSGVPYFMIYHPALPTMPVPMESSRLPSSRMARSLRPNGWPGLSSRLAGTVFVSYSTRASSRLPPSK